MEATLVDENSHDGSHNGYSIQLDSIRVTIQGGYRVYLCFPVYRQLLIVSNV